MTLFPIEGIYYFITHSECWYYFKLHLGPLFVLCLIVYSFTVIIYLTTLIITGGFLSFFTIAAFQPANIIIQFVSKFLLLPKPLRRTFDHVLIQELGLEVNHIGRGGLVNDVAIDYKETKFGRLFRRCRFTITPCLWLAREVVLLCVGFIPFIGPVLVILLKASRVGFTKHKRYFKLKGYNRSQIYFIWKTRKHQYFYFGLVVVILEMIPFLNVLFFFTDITGAALWAAHIEKEVCDEYI